ncbi:uncharacterized protein LOC122859739 [Aphidius gifuensis]|uniref:uncharacterized protein LOC122859739 n=1 Tax=Aphidius gifuensis TaxID=684658 RepID=UPI001CDC9172|nr:uncharacterized protein LOC122859739 [Aphidius gifuensis]
MEYQKILNLVQHHVIVMEEFIAKNDARRYKWVKDAYYSDADNTYGDKGTGCSDGLYIRKEYERESFTRCPFCWCQCDDVSPKSKLAVNTISLLPAMSSIAKNKVVTGARMIIKDNIFNIQVAEGVIGPNYIVQAFTDEWVRLPSIVNDVQESLDNGGQGKLKQNTDYVLWDPKKNAINMDEMTIEYGRVVTGIKFGIENVEGKFPNRIQIQVHSTEYDWKSGKLIKDTEKWHYPDGNHTVTSDYGELNPVKTNEKTVIDSQTDKFYTLSMSDSKTDAGQTTLPLFDASYVGSKVPTALSGIGLHHRSSNRENGGFFGITAYSVIYDKYMSELNLET